MLKVVKTRSMAPVRVAAARPDHFSSCGCCTVMRLCYSLACCCSSMRYRWVPMNVSAMKWRAFVLFMPPGCRRTLPPPTALFKSSATHRGSRYRTGKLLQMADSCH